MRRQIPDYTPKNLSAEAKKLFFITLINSLILAFIYFGSMATNIVVIPPYVITAYPIMLGQIIYSVYWTVFAVFIIVYLVYNRAFRRKGITPDMLPDTMSAEKKEEYINDGKRRQADSKWMLSVIIPLLITIGLDAIYLFTWPMVQNLFKF